MSCDLSDPRILETYNEIIAGKPTNWMILGYHDSRDTISLYSSGSGGTEELRGRLSDEVLYVFMRILDHRFVLVSYVSENVSGVRRARALVHGRTVALLLKDFDIQISASKSDDLKEENLKPRVKPNDDNLIAGQAAFHDGHSPPVVPLRTKKSNRNQKDAAPSEMGGSRSQELSPVSPDTPLSDSLTTESFAPSYVAEEPPDDQGRGNEAAAREAAEETARRMLAEADRIAQEAAAREEKRKAAEAAAAAKKKAEAEKRAAEAERQRAKNIRQHKPGDAASVKGWITIQFENVIWKRRWFELRGKAMHLFKDPNDLEPIDIIELGPQIDRIEDAQPDVLIPNSFKIVHKTRGQVYMYSDNEEARKHAVAGIQKAAT